MVEDKLGQRQRIRLECLAQARVSSPPDASAEQIVEKALRFERFVFSGKA